MEAPLEEIEFLARSQNRVEVLRLVAAEPRTRQELATATGASQATLGRILEDFADRSWVSKEDRRHAATATGELVADGISGLISVLETEQKLRPLVAYLPTEEFGFDLRHLADATVTVPTRTRPSAPLQQVRTAIEGADTLRAFSHTLNEQTLSTVHEQVTGGDYAFEAVLSRSALEALAADASLWSQVRELSRRSNATIRVSEGEIPVAALIADGTVSLLVRDEHGILRASLSTDSAAVREWATDRFDRYWERANPFSPLDFN
ncbi:helix-turn-helix transcriptional regulator [Halorubrum sp. HHNYT27]|uniref:helix-turn-helix transcriptional regulator n=1 Tax=Halorubrum sp. HHNYT27 TaxID=3402275 RepID=UPI003EBC3025